MRSTTSSTGASISRSRSVGPLRGRRTAPAARPRPRWPRCSPGGSRCATPRSRRPRSRRAQWRTGSPSLAPARDRSTSWGCAVSSLADVGEAGLLAELARRGLASGIDDDVAVLDGDLVVTQDALVEDVHFRLAWTSFRDLGYKAAAVNLSDLAAAGAEPEALIVTLGAPATTRLA